MLWPSWRSSGTMKHRHSMRKLGRTSAHRWALLRYAHSSCIKISLTVQWTKIPNDLLHCYRNLVSQLVQHERIETTVPKVSFDWNVYRSPNFRVFRMHLPKFIVVIKLQAEERNSSVDPRVLLVVVAYASREADKCSSLLHQGFSNLPCFFSLSSAF